MGQEALGPHWSSFTPVQLKEFLGLFRVLMQRICVQQLLLFENPNLSTRASIAPVPGRSWISRSSHRSVAPVPPVSLLGGKLLARVVVGTAQLLLLLVFGHFVYGLRLGHSPVAMIMVATAVVASMTCFAAVVAAFVRTREQAIPVGLALAFVLASLGGLFWPLYNLPGSMQAIASALITTWSMSALQDVMLRDRSLVAVSPELLVLVAYGLVSFMIALQLFRYEGEAQS
jgi:ABC-type multidrug transport system permease subunit